MPHHFRTPDGTLRKAGEFFPVRLANGTEVTIKWGGSAQKEKLHSWWLAQPGHELAQSEEVSEVAVRDDDAKKTRWGSAPAGARLFFVVKPPAVAKDGSTYRLALLVTAAATAEEFAYFRDERFVLFGILRPDGSMTIIPPLPPPPPDSPIQGELF
jgi:hypothetical protein